MSTPFNSLIQKFFHKIEKDRDFFSYYNVTLDEAMELAKSQSINYLYEAIERLVDECTPDVDFFDYNEDIAEFNFDLTKKEQGIMSDLMREVYFDRDLSLLKAFKISLTPSDLNQFSPAAERKTFTDMLKEIKNENAVKISQYASVDRLTGKKKLIDYSQCSD